MREYAQALETTYLRPFVQQRGLGEQEILTFRAALASTCRQLADRRVDILPNQSLSEEDFAAMAQGAAREDLSRMLLGRIAEIAPLDPLVADFLAEQGLLGDALIYFLREKLRRDDRVQRTLSALQQQGVWADLRDTQASLAQLQQAVQQAMNERQGQVQQALQQGDYAQLATLTSELRQLAQRQGQLPELLAQAQAAWRANETRLEGLSGRFQVWSELAQVRLEQIGELLSGLSAQLDDLGRAMGAGFDRLGDDLGQLKAHLGAQAVAFRAVIQLLERQGLGVQVAAGDEFSPHTDASRHIIQEAYRALERLPRGPGYAMASVAVGSAFSSTGDAARAEALFLQAYQAAGQDHERALASYNLFQVRLRQGSNRYPDALESLREAVRLDPARYAPHDVHKYPIERLLGAGGMGCAFLCRDAVFERPAVVKTFWKARRGSLQEIFAEARIMARLPDGHVPKPLDYGFAHGQERPYIAMEYLEGYVDGEAWLAARGALSLADGLGVGVQVAQALAAAHGAKVAHLDLKPANLLLKQTPSGLAVRIIDFGLARVAERLGGNSVQASRAGKSLLAQEILGTWDYAPPEQMGEPGLGAPGPKSDLYAFGATLYRLLSGQSPRHFRPKYLPKDVPADLCPLIEDLLEHDPKARPESAAVVQRRLEAMLPPSSPTNSPLPAGEGTGVREKSPQQTPTLPPVENIHGWSAAKVQARQQSTAQALNLPVGFRHQLSSGGQGPDMVVIPAGRFLMGSPQSEVGRSNNERQHEVVIERPFAIGRYAVTRGEFARFVQATGYRTTGEQQGGLYVWDGKAWQLDAKRDWRQPGFDQGEDHPVVGVSYWDALAYGDWLAQQTGGNYRLPTEAEWEYACRAGTTTARYWGEDPAQACRYANVADLTAKEKFPDWEVHNCRDGYVYTAPVGRFQPNAWGLYDMLGNVWEWTGSVYVENYDGSERRLSGKNDVVARRVFRGGSWYNAPAGVRSASRAGLTPVTQGNSLRGFRLAQDI